MASEAVSAGAPWGCTARQRLLALVRLRSGEGRARHRPMLCDSPPIVIHIASPTQGGRVGVVRGPPFSLGNFGGPPRPTPVLVSTSGYRRRCPRQPRHLGVAAARGGGELWKTSRMRRAAKCALHGMGWDTEPWAHKPHRRRGGGDTARDP
ncbi:hypothetical protein EJ04DRAFT_591429 [Polyplosphaeria fusca]|uniref:Uncharacterized protein n=1 Tax=Polyplosphaeria fusca TaxID=682080 RepID=A0A9P4QPF9_9PLEO|nr:hypothetical protein EJ04DRAFT_591429 [Polyplosphaeria fusca]